MTDSDTLNHRTVNMQESALLAFRNGNQGHKLTARHPALLELEVAIAHSTQSLRYFLREQHNTFAPIACLSDELIVEILKYCMDHQNQVQTRPPRTNKIPPAYSLSVPISVSKFPPHVCELTLWIRCSHWRNAAVHCPSLWSTIYLPEPTPLFELFQSRSGICPLHVFVSSDNMPDDEEDEDETLSQLGDNLRKLAPRISHLHV